MGDLGEAPKDNTVSMLDPDETVPLISPSGDDRASETGPCQRIVAGLLYPFRLAYNNGVVCCVVTQLLYAFLAILFKKLAKNEIPVFQTLFLRSVSVVIGCPIAMWYLGYTSIFGPRECYGYLALRAVLGSFAMICYFVSNTLIPVGDAMALSKLVPIFTVIFSCALRWEVVNLLMGAGAIICSAGGLVILRPPFIFGGGGAWDRDEIIGNSMAFGSAITMSIAYMAIGKMGTKVGEYSMAFAEHLVALVLVSIPLIIQFPDPPVFKFTWEVFFLYLMFLPLAFIALIMVIRGIQLCDGVQGTSLQTVGVVFSYALGLLLLHEKITIFAITGTLVIGVGIWMVAIGKARALRHEVDFLAVVEISRH